MTTRRPLPPFGHKDAAWERDRERVYVALQDDPEFVAQRARIEQRGYRVSGDGIDPCRASWDIADRLDAARRLLRGHVVRWVVMDSMGMDTPGGQP